MVAGSTDVDVTDEDELAFDAALAAATTRETESRIPTERSVGGRPVVWAPQPGSQEEFLACPLFEALYHGTRGPGKTDALIMDFAQHVGQGHGEAWRGIIFRETYPQLADLVAKTVKWFRQIFPTAKFVRAKPLRWEFETGEILFMSYMRSPDDYWNYHGHEYPWIAFEELTSWADDRCYKSMFACCRSSAKDVPRKIRATTNPYGVGHNWVKERWRLHGRWWTPVVTIDSKDLSGNVEPPRVAIHGHIDENLLLLEADPNYKQTIAASAHNEAMAAAWLHGSWDVVAGGMFSDVWSQEHNNVGRFEVPFTWRIDRAFDWGSSKPFSVGWYAQSDGSDLRFNDGRVVSTVRGDVFRIREWYGWTGRANEGTRSLAVEVAAGVAEREFLWGWRERGHGRNRCKAGPADSSIFTVENGRSIGLDMEKPIRMDGNVISGVTWTRADKSPGSRKAGWEQMRAMIKAGQPPKGGGVREDPGLFVVGEECPQFLRTVLALPRDEKDLDDVDTDAEDHIGDEVRYRVRSSGTRVGSGRTTGMH
tara:strand:- start:17967 stop:19574 length:1608 start_codon:yes stop_codon:yes gene_type:complete